MKPETEAKAIIALIISLIAFGCGSGAGIVMGLSPNDTQNTSKVNTSQEMPPIQSTKNVDTNTQVQTNSNQEETSSQPTYVPNNQKKSNGTSNQNNNDTNTNNDGNTP